jgi:molybdate transport system ATP-binding protein
VVSRLVTRGLAATIRVRIGDLDLDAAIDVAAGRTVALVGPNGAGKTTFVRAVAGLIRIDSGRIAIDDAVVDDAAATFVPPEHRSVGVVFQDNVLFPHLRVIDNVAFAARAAGSRRANARKAASLWLERVGLQDLAEARPSRLSGGEAQRVALARALAREPSLLLLDEPFAALDATTLAETRRFLAHHLDDHAGPRLLVTHDPVDAAALADDIVVLEAGRVVQRGSIDALTRRPQSRYVADLVGTNLLRGTARGNMVFLSGGARLASADASDDGDVFVVFHPRAVAVHRTAPEGSPRNVWRGTVDAIDRQGDRMRLHVRGEVSVVAEVTAGAAAELAVAPGAEVWVTVKATEVAVYPT